MKLIVGVHTESSMWTCQSQQAQLVQAALGRSKPELMSVAGNVKLLSKEL